MPIKSQSTDNFLLSKLLFLIIILFFTFQGCSEVGTLHYDSIQEIHSGNYEGAIRILKEILTIEKANPRYLNNLGWALFRNEDFDEAEVVLKKAEAKCESEFLMDSIKINLEMVSTFQRGKELLQGKKYDEAKKEFEKVTSKYNTEELELKYFALCLEGMGKYDEANEKWEKIVDMHEGSETPNKFYLLATEKLSKDRPQGDL